MPKPPRCLHRAMADPVLALRQEIDRCTFALGVALVASVGHFNPASLIFAALLLLSSKEEPASRKTQHWVLRPRTTRFVWAVLVCDLLLLPSVVFLFVACREMKSLLTTYVPEECAPCSLAATTGSKRRRERESDRESVRQTENREELRLSSHRSPSLFATTAHTARRPARATGGRSRSKGRTQSRSRMPTISATKRCSPSRATNRSAPRSAPAPTGPRARCSESSSTSSTAATHASSPSTLTRGSPTSLRSTPRSTASVRTGDRSTPRPPWTGWHAPL